MHENERATPIENIVKSLKVFSSWREKKTDTNVTTTATTTAKWHRPGARKMNATRQNVKLKWNKIKWQKIIYNMRCCNCYCCYYYWVFFGGRCHFDSNSSTSATAAATRYLYGALPILTDRAILSHTETHAQRVTHMCECVFVCAFKCVFLFSIRFGLRFFHSPSFSLFGFFGFATFYYLC